jgi:hypothetical protein
LSDGVDMDHNNLKEQIQASDSFTPRGAKPAGGRGVPGRGFGTHHAGTFVGAWDSGDTRGVAGVPGKAQVISCNLLPADSNGATFLELMTDCVKHAADRNASWVVSNTWVFLNPLPASTTTIQLTREAIQQFVCDKGGVFVVAAGEGLCRDFPEYGRTCTCTNFISPWICGGGVQIGVNISDAGIYPNGTRAEGLRKIYPAAFAEELDCVIAVANIGYTDAAKGMKADQMDPPKE